MSYEIIKNMKVNFKKFELVINHESNNVSPKQFYNTKIVSKNESEFIQELQGVFENLIQGNWKFTIPSKSVVHLAFLRTTMDISLMWFWGNKNKEEKEKLFQNFLKELKEGNPQKKIYCKKIGIHIY